MGADPTESRARWREIERLFHAVLAEPVEARLAFLSEVCGDPETRREVEELLAQKTDGAFRTGGALLAGAAMTAKDIVSPTGQESHAAENARLSGWRLGVYEIGALLGKGGMGEVYRARDTRLSRDVALKVLPRVFNQDAGRLTRFKREARMLAALTHPHVATIHGTEEGIPHGPSTSVQPEIFALVMELVEGETLADRLGRGPLPVDEALGVAVQIASALEAAHEKGIVHRDLKPANIKLRPDGWVKVLDFGLAKTVSTAGRLSRTSGAAVGATREGALVGTVPYMSPEQVRGQPVDKRADIWAFGCVLYEMLTGRQAFEADTVSDAVAAVLQTEPDLGRLPGRLSAVLRAFLSCSFQKDPRQRLRDIGDMRLALQGAFEASSEAGLRPTPDAVWRRALPFAGTVLGTAVVVGGVLGLLFTSPSQPVVTRLALEQSAAQPLDFTNDNSPVLALSPDGTRVAYRISLGGVSTLVVRALDGLAATPLSQGSLGTGPFFSPDGAWIAFNDGSDDTLKRVATAGGPAQTITSVDSTGLRGGSWGPGDTIVFATGRPSGLWQVSAGGGTAEVLTTLDGSRGEFNHAWPELLPGNQAVLFTIQHDRLNRDADEIALRDLNTGVLRVLLAGGAYPKYARSGHLVYGFGRKLWAVAFDPARRVVTGLSRVVVDDVSGMLNGGMQVAMASNGTLAYGVGHAALLPSERQLGTVDPDGGWTALDVPPGRYAHPRVSHDGRWLAVERQAGSETDVWLYELSGGHAMQRLSEAGNNRYPVWSRDGQFVVFQSDREGDHAIFRQRADATSPAERLTEPEPGSIHVPEDWSPVDDLLAFDVIRGDSAELWLWNLEDRRAQRMPDVESTQPVYSAFSPDGRWLAYTERHPDGTVRTYVQALPPAVGRYALGTDSELVHHPLWSADGNRLFYFPAANPLVSVAVSTQPTPTFGSPVALAGNGLPVNVLPGTPRNHDIAPNGAIVGVFSAEELRRGQPVPPHIIVVQNWTEELKRLVPAD